MNLNLNYALRIIVFIGITTFTSCKKDTKTQKQQKTEVLETGNDTMPEVWIDKDTHHKVEKLTLRAGNNRSFYFHNNPFLPTKNSDGTLMVFYGNTSKKDKQFFTVNLETKETTQITNKKGNKKGEILGSKTRKVFFVTRDSIFATDIDTKTTTFIYKFPEDVIASVSSLNADETLLAGTLISKEEEAIFKKHPTKRGYFDRIYEAKLERTLITINIETGKMEKIHSENAWLNHVQFSPTNPDLLMYCHEGPWHKVDRIWNIDVKTKVIKKIHERTVHREIAGHEFFSPDGQTIWYDLQIPRGETFYLASKTVKTNKAMRYALKRDMWSIHYNISPDLKTFAGDGGDEGQVAHAKDGRWLYHFTPKKDSLISEKLVNMQHHNYDLEPNVHFSPDGKRIIFRANFEGSTQIYAVEIKKTILN